MLKLDKRVLQLKNIDTNKKYSQYLASMSEFSSKLKVI